MMRLNRPLCRVVRRQPSRTTLFISTVQPITPSFSKPSTSKRLWLAYCRALEQNPLAVKASMASLIFVTSDVATQWYDGLLVVLDPTDGKTRTITWDAVRTASAAGFGVVATTWLHYWWGLLEGVVGRYVPCQRSKLANTVTKVILDQGLGAPLYIYSYYLLTNVCSHASSDVRTVLSETHQKASDMLLPTMMQHWKLWPLVHTVNFYYTPLHHRVLVQNSILVFWSGYLSHLNHQHQLITPDQEMEWTAQRREPIRRIQTSSTTSTRVNTKTATATQATTQSSSS